MNLDWLKAISARLEGRTAIICAGLVFCAFGLWLFVLHPPANATVAIAFETGILLLAAGVMLIPLLKKPQPSEPTPKFLVQQIGNQWFYTGGHDSTPELISMLREARNIKPLPAPTAIVEGALKDSTRYRTLSPSEAEDIQLKDEAAVERMLRSEAEKLRSALNVVQLAGGTAQDTDKLQTK